MEAIDKEEGGCLCGIPNCPGHELVDGKINIKGHPTIPDGEVELILPEDSRRAPGDTPPA